MIKLTEEDFEKACDFLISMRKEENRREVNVALYCILDKWFNTKEASIRPILKPHYTVSWEENRR